MQWRQKRLPNSVLHVQCFAVIINLPLFKNIFSFPSSFWLMPLKTILGVRRFRMKNSVMIWLKTSDEINVRRYPYLGSIFIYLQFTMCACSLILSALVFTCSCAKRPLIITLQIIYTLENSVITALKTMIIFGGPGEISMSQLGHNMHDLSSRTRTKHPTRSARWLNSPQCKDM